MSRKPKITSQNFEQTVMSKVRDREIVMKPRWYFFLGSVLLFFGLVSLSISAIFLTNLTLFLLRRHGPMGEWKLQLILNSFPLWIPLAATVGIIFGIWILQKYDFSYKNSFKLITVGFVAAIILSALALNSLGLNEGWSKQGPMRQFYQQIQPQNSPFPTTGMRPMQNRQGNGFFRQGR
jgi:hypothetical protein